MLLPLVLGGIIENQNSDFVTPYQWPYPGKANLALWRDEVRILIFDDPAENERGQRPVMVRSGRGPFRPGHAARARCMNFFFENLRNPARTRFAGLMRQFRFNQLYSISCTEPL
jgi:hypothetical protein